MNFFASIMKLPSIFSIFLTLVPFLAILPLLNKFEEDQFDHKKDEIIKKKKFDNKKKQIIVRVYIEMWEGKGYRIFLTHFSFFL